MLAFKDTIFPPMSHRTLPSTHKDLISKQTTTTQEAELSQTGGLVQTEVVEVSLPEEEVSINNYHHQGLSLAHLFRQCPQMTGLPARYVGDLVILLCAVGTDSTIVTKNMRCLLL